MLVKVLSKDGKTGVPETKEETKKSKNVVDIYVVSNK